MRLLIVEDDDDCAEALATSFQDVGYNVAVARTVATLRDALEHERFDCVLLDLYLEDGQAATDIPWREVRTPIVIFSGWPQRDLEVVSRQIGACACIPKPSGLDDILNAVDKACQSGR